MLCLVHARFHLFVGDDDVIYKNLTKSQRFSDSQVQCPKIEHFTDYTNMNTHTHCANNTQHRATHTPTTTAHTSTLTGSLHTHLHTHKHTTLYTQTHTCTL